MARGIAAAAADIRVDKGLVLVPVSALDSDYRPVPGLSKANFRVFDDTIERPIESLSMEDEPSAVAIVFDSSGSMGRKLSYARAAIREFFGTANPGDEFCLVEFNDGPALTVPLTSDTRAIETRLAAARPVGRTALLDAVHLGLNEVRRSRKHRKALLIVSDGGDNHSRYNESSIRNLVRESDALIYAVGIYEPLDLSDQTPEHLPGLVLLRELAAMGGGREFDVGYASELGDTARAISVALRNVYVLGFSPSSPPDGRFHKLKIKTARTRSFIPNLSWRLGYYALPPALSAH